MNKENLISSTNEQNKDTLVKKDYTFNGEANGNDNGKPYKGYFSTVWTLFKNCWSFMGHNKDLFLLPILSVVTMLVIIAALFSSYYLDLNHIGGLSTQSTSELVALAVVSVSALFLIIYTSLFFSAAMTAIILKRLAGEKCTVREGIAVAKSRWFRILQWSLVSLSISLIIHAIERSHRRMQNVMGSIIGVSWGVATFFALPAIVNQNVGPIDAVKISAKQMRSRWGRVASVGLFISIITISITAAIFAVLLAVTHSATIAQGSLAAPGGFSILFIPSIAVAAAIMTPIRMMLTSINKSAIYLSNFANCDVKGFDNDSLKNSIRFRR